MGKFIILMFVVASLTLAFMAYMAFDHFKPIEIIKAPVEVDTIPYKPTKPSASVKETRYWIKHFNKGKYDANKQKIVEQVSSKNDEGSQ